MAENNNIPSPASAEELEREQAQIFLPEDEWQDVDIEGDWLNPLDEWETAKNSLFIDDAPICALGGVTISTGQSGNGKTMTMAMMMSAIFRGSYGQFKRGESITTPTVLYVDTEMEKYNTQRLMNRVYYICGWEFKTVKPEFRIIRLRGTVSVEDRWKKVLKAIATVRPTFCFLDGLLDLVYDFNNNIECHSLIYKLMAAAEWYDMSVIGVIHKNPNGEKMAGHIGSFGGRKAITVLDTKKDKSGQEVVFVVTQEKARDKDAQNVKFKVNDDKMHIGIPEPLDASAITAHDMMRSLETIMCGLTLTTRELRQKVVEKLRLNETEAMDYIKKAVEADILNVVEEWTKDHTRCKSRYYTFNEHPNAPF